MCGEIAIQRKTGTKKTISYAPHSEKPIQIKCITLNMLQYVIIPIPKYFIGVKKQRRVQPHNETTLEMCRSIFIDRIILERLLYILFFVAGQNMVPKSKK